MNVRKGCFMKFTKSAPLWGEITVPGDKSISHRAVMLGSLAEGTTEVTNFLKGADCISTIRAFQAMGIDIEEKEDTLLIHGKGLHGLQAPKETLDMGNSGTTTRLLSGILAGQTFETTLTGDDSLKKRPMNRIITPLSQMGAQIESLPGNGCLPLRITGSSLKGIHYETPMKSAQVKSAILAGWSLCGWSHQRDGVRLSPETTRNSCSAISVPKSPQRVPPQRSIPNRI